MNKITEDDVVFVASEFFRHLGWYILCREASQTSRFKISLPNGRNKYPDLVICKEGLLLVFECKINFADLFKSDRLAIYPASDFESMTYLQKSDECKKSIMAEANQMLSSAKLNINISQLQCGILALDNHPKLDLTNLEGIVVACVDIITEHVKMINLDQI